MQNIRFMAKKQKKADIKSRKSEKRASSRDNNLKVAIGSREMFYFSLWQSLIY